MQPHFPEFVGIAAAAASLYSAQSKTIIPLRTAAIVANFLGMIYFLMHDIYPTFILNAVMLPLNAWRLRSIISLIRETDAAIESDMNVEWLLPYTHPKNFKAGAILMEHIDELVAARAGRISPVAPATLVLLVGPRGTGKSSVALGLAPWSALSPTWSRRRRDRCQPGGWQGRQGWHVGLPQDLQPLRCWCRPGTAGYRPAEWR
jgi:hypothetical protein